MGSALARLGQDDTGRAGGWAGPLLALTADWAWEADAGHRLTRLARTDGGPGCGLAHWLGLAPWELPQAGDAAAQRACMEGQQAFSGFQTCHEDAHGRRVWLQWTGTPRRARGRFAGWRGIARDISAQKEAERALNESEMQLAAVIDAASEAILSVDEAGCVVLFNGAAGQMFGCPRADALGASLERFAPQALQFIRTVRRPSAPAAPSLVRSLAVQAQRWNGEAFPAEVSISRVEHGGRTYHCLMLRDLAPRLAAEEARQALELQLRQSQKMEALGTMAGGIAHDFNNIVAAIIGNAALAKASCGLTPGAPFLTEIEKAGLRARDLVQRIMAFSRKQPAVFSTQALQPLVEEGVQLLRATLPSGIAIESSMPAERVHVRADPTQITQVLMNLGTNAWQALGSEPGHIRITVEAAGREVRLSVSDDGCGMDAATQSRIFEPFFTTKAKGEGTGLGLPVVHGIVQSHGGRIAVHSERGQGTTFDIWLPVTAAPEAGEPEAVPSAVQPPAQGGGRHVLYLDDYPAMVFMMRATLESLGYRFTGFESPRDALDWLRQNLGEVDLVVTDHNMPGGSGLELAHAIRALRPGLPVILASGYITDELREGARRAGVADVFDKPRGIEELCGLIGKVLAA
ncbi:MULTISPECIES: ATP-binding protein [Ramlibacter]|uniref:histidine kinase n=1 Tax=Ramlibacter aquaticus TaxID=2780094 RepID=A0ABR9SAC7_9BURK|nr:MULTISPECIES: ATP-binding protein [Ramlibacter]MBE7939288.1 PAS domain S-box protein [Ramlibacter aquaticus]